MITKLFEIRDRETCIPVMAIRMEPGCERDGAILSRAGYGLKAEAQRRYIMLLDLADHPPRSATTDPYGHTQGRTLFVAHYWLESHFDEFGSGAVIDVEHVLGEKPVPSESEL